MSMPVEPVQSYANHVRRPPSLYYASCTALVLGALGFAWISIRQPSLPSVAALLAILGAGGIAWYARINALIVQDRVIRLEERVRLDRLLPGDLKPRIGELSIAQLASLRFASDEEVVELVRQVLAEWLHDRRTIKKRIRSWRADWLRV
jgi:hypothetical protein